MLTLLVAFAVALVTTLLIVRGAMPGSGWTSAMDGQMDGPQKFHAAPVPRTGGLGIVWGLVVALLLVSFQHHEAAGPGWWLLLCAAPVFVAGLAEDLTKRVGPAVRLSASIGSALLAAWLLGASLQATGVPLLDMLVAGAVGSIALT
ncbi:MAG: hypothetical protein ACO3PV_12780, partial [Pseudohongiellaceae bacterium]